jgi:hypothetical protein
MSHELESGEPREDKEKTPSIEGASAKETTQSPPPRPPTIPSIPFYFKPWPIYVERPKKEEKYGIEWWKTRLEIAGMLVGLGVGVLLFFQWREMVAATKATQGQLNEMKRTRVLDERAWVVATGEIAMSQNNDMVVFSVPYKNTGKTPAINFESVTGWQTNQSLIPNEDAYPFLNNHQGVCAPDDGGKLPTAPMPAIILSDVSKNSRQIFIFGTIWYDDIFGGHHWSRFAYSLNQDPMNKSIIRISSLQIHNSCDDAQTNQAN